MTANEQKNFPTQEEMNDIPNETWEKLKNRLKKSLFRSKFHLNGRDREYAIQKGFCLLSEHAVDFISKRVAPAFPKNDGKQTPMRGHPVFVAQHATATCCRLCLQKWHGIKAGKELSKAEKEYIVSVIMRWIKDELK